jgi:hypothetical protein
MSSNAMPLIEIDPHFTETLERWLRNAKAEA